MKLSIVIVNYNVQHYLQLCLDSVFAATRYIESEIIVVDNNSSDSSVKMIQEYFSEVKLIQNIENLGFSKANNIGVAAATGEYICILNPDTFVGEHIFENIFAFAKANPKLGVLGVRLVDGTGKYLSESKRNLPTAKVSLKKLLGNSKSYYANHISSDAEGEVSILVGAFMFLKKEIYAKVQGFDERYFMYGEDIDLSHSIAQLGYMNYYFGSEAIIHFKGESTIKNEVYRKRFYGAMKLFYDKHFKKGVLEDSLIALGLKAARFKSKIENSWKHHNNVNVKSNPKAYVFLSDNDIIYMKLKRVITAPLNILLDKDHFNKGDEVIFDATYMSYESIISKIITHRGKSVTFKIIPKNSTFAIGSNTSEGRGDMIHFNK